MNKLLALTVLWSTCNGWALATAQLGSVKAKQKISETAGGFGGVLDPQEQFAGSVSGLGDLDGDGIVDLAVGAPEDGSGAVWILFLNTDGTVKAQQRISATTGGFGGTLAFGDHFGNCVAPLEDLDGDGVIELAVGAYQDDDGGSGQGAVWILFLNTNGTVKTQQKISETAGGFGGVLEPEDYFGYSASSVGDLDGDGNTDVAVGAVGDVDRGAVWILFLDADGTVNGQQKISETAGGFGGTLNPGQLGSSVASLGDLDGDGIVDLALGEQANQDGGVQLQGAVWIVFLDADGTVKAEQKINETAGGFGGVLEHADLFGIAVTSLEDLDSDGVRELAVGAVGDDDGDLDAGAAWIVLLNTDGTVKAHQKISQAAGELGDVLDHIDKFGNAVTSLGDLDGDGTGDLAVGVRDDDDGGLNQGAVWILFLQGPDTMPPILVCPPLVTVLDSKGGSPGDTVFYDVTATDDLDPTPSVVCVPPSGSFFPRGTTLVTCTATDNLGNQAVCMFPVVVLPTIAQRQL